MRQFDADVFEGVWRKKVKPESLVESNGNFDGILPTYIALESPWQAHEGCSFLRSTHRLRIRASLMTTVDLERKKSSRCFDRTDLWSD